jgi:hypothetical protein
LLGDVFGFRLVAEHFRHGGDNPILMNLHQHLERSGVAILDAEHELDVPRGAFVRGFGWDGRFVGHEKRGR